ncbi:MAG: 50S ribosomal protein L23 [Deltaproteobacteria bacterium]|nr:50S ribosomal protein L23 [Deltaproteobacteria bacterium]
MKNQFNVIIQPHLTEKVVDKKESENKVAFKVHPSANKIEIKNAIENIFKVKVEKVSTLNQHGKKRRMGNITGRKPDWKKAVVTLKKGDTIEYFEGA